MNNRMLLAALVVIIIIAAVAYQQNTHTTKIDLPGNNDVKITTHD